MDKVFICEKTPYRGESLAVLEHRIQTNLTSAYIQIGLDLRDIKDNDLFKNAGFNTFKEYYTERWGFVLGTAYLHIQAAEVGETLAAQNSENLPNFTQARELAKLDPDQQKLLAETTLFRDTPFKELKKKVATLRVADTLEIFEPLPQDKYSVAICDCPWQYDFTATNNRAIENHYPTLPTDEICALPIQEVFPKDNARLFFWATAPKLPDALRVLHAWGFEYKTHMVWVKEKPGMGYHTRGEHELLLIATKGDMPAPLPELLLPSVMTEARREHSKKPEWAYRMIETQYPNTPKIELFAREKRPGWLAWGTKENQKGAI